MSGRQVRFRVLGIDCAHDAARVEHDVLQLSRVRSASVSAATHVLTLELDEGGEADVDRVVSGLGYHLEPFDNNQTPATAPAYRRALIVVVVLNLTFGVAEMAGGFVSGSQALKADALDFIGDGLITMLAVIAIGWRMIWRARAAFLQGVFLGLLGLSVLATAAFRLVGGDPPEPEIMGGSAWWRFSSTSVRPPCWSRTVRATQMCARSGCSRETMRSPTWRSSALLAQLRGPDRRGPISRWRWRSQRCSYIPRSRLSDTPRAMRSISPEKMSACTGYKAYQYSHPDNPCGAKNAVCRMMLPPPRAGATSN